MAAARTTKDHIIRSAIVVLQASGTEGLTMRKVAGQAGMSLGNLQYHFKDKTALMGGLAASYFAECASMLDGYRHTPPDGAREEQLHHFILSLLDHVHHVDRVSDMCRVFREMWALSAREPDIRRQLVDYYRVTFEKLTTALVPVSSSARCASHIASLLMPYIEGYSITCEALPMAKQETALMLTELCRGFLCDAESVSTGSD